MPLAWLWFLKTGVYKKNTYTIPWWERNMYKKVIIAGITYAFFRIILEILGMCQAKQSQRYAVKGIPFSGSDIVLKDKTRRTTAGGHGIKTSGIVAFVLGGCIGCIGAVLHDEKSDTRHHQLARGCEQQEYQRSKRADAEPFERPFRKKQLILVQIVCVFLCLGLSGCIQPPRASPDVEILHQSTRTGRDGENITAYIDLILQNHGGLGSVTVWARLSQAESSWTKKQTIEINEGEIKELTFAFTAAFQEVDFWDPSKGFYSVWVE